MLKIQSARVAKGMTRAELAELVGRKPRTVQAWELNQRSPRLQDLGKIADALGTTVANLLGEVK